tara:strand:- start:3947 stop:4381 length:435 start_codon:yes stop_codon:yes gene_type:complete
MNVVISSRTVFYTIERSIKEYRKFAQKNISAQVSGITVDQALILFYIEKYPELSQKEIATLVFKDNASVTRIINLIVSKGYLKRSINEVNRRRFKLEISKLGAEVLFDLTPIVIRNRAEALKGLTEKELIQLESTLNKIIKNCI